MAKIDGTLGSVATALDILIFLAGEDGETGLTEIARHFGLGKSTVHRVLSTLKSRQFVEQNEESEKYRVGVRAFEVGHAYFAQAGLTGAATPVMENLVRECNEKVNLAILDRTYGDMVVVKQVEPNRPLTVFSKVGSHAMCHCTAMGKAILGRLSWPDALEIVSRRGLQKRTSKTIVDPEALRLDLEAGVRRGYCFDDEEQYEEVRCVAAPIFDHTGAAVAALSLAGPAYRINIDRFHELGKLVAAGANEISRKLGYRPNGVPAQSAGS